MDWAGFIHLNETISIIEKCAVGQRLLLGFKLKDWRKHKRLLVFHW